MADDISSTVRQALVDAVRAVAGGGRQRARGTGTWVRTDADGTGWVMLTGATEPTPVSGQTTAAASEGDTVQWELDGTTLNVTGNASAPSVGGKYVEGAVKPVERKADAAQESADAAAEAAEDAAKTATKYITSVDEDGIWVTPEGAGPSEGAAVATTSGWHISDALELFRLGVSVFKVWVESATTYVRVGAASAANILMGGSSLSIYSGDVQAMEVTAEVNSDGDTSARIDLSPDGLTYISSITESEDSGSTYQHHLRIQAYQNHDTSEYDAAFIDLTASTEESRIGIYGKTFSVTPYGEDGQGVDMSWVKNTLMGGKTLYSGAYADSSATAITLSEGATGYGRLLVEYVDAGERFGSVWVDAPAVGTTFGLQTVAANPTSGVIVRSKTCEISTTSSTADTIDVAAYGSGSQYGKLVTDTSGASTWSYAQEIGITKVLGFMPIEATPTPSRLPAGYQEVEYLEGDGSAYIDTGMVLSKSCIITLDFYIAASSTNLVAFGWRWGGTYRTGNQIYINRNQSRSRLIVAGVGSTTAAVGSSTCFDEDARTVLVIDGGAESITVNGTAATFTYNLTSGTAYDTNSTTGVEPYLFALDSIDHVAAISTSDVRIYGYKVEQGGATLQELVPCYRTADSVAGYYDLVSDTFLTNAGSGSFTVGPDVTE